MNPLWRDTSKSGHEPTSAGSTIDGITYYRSGLVSAAPSRIREYIDRAIEFGKRRRASVHPAEVPHD